MFKNTRIKIFNFAISGLVVGQRLPWWGILIRSILFPLDFLFWKMSGTRGYNNLTDTWQIDGVKYSGRSLRDLSMSTGQIYKIKRSADVVWLELQREADLNYSSKWALSRIAKIIEDVDNRCMAADGPITTTLDEMRQDEISMIYNYAKKGL